MQQDTPSPTKFKKAGFALMGINQDEQMCVLMSYTQGRFNPDPTDRTKYYGLTKGSIDDKDDSPIDAAERETFEETGISIKRLLGAENYEKYKNGEKLGRFESAGYPGVIVKTADPNVDVRYTYESVAGKNRPTILFPVEVENIEKLARHLKRVPMHEELALASDVRHPSGRLQPASPHEATLTGDTIADYVKTQEYPTFDELLTVLRTGHIDRKDDSPWASEARTIIEEPLLPKLESKYNQQIKTAEQLADFYRHTISGDEFKALQDNIGLIKQHLEHEQMIGDHLAVKLDDKDFPLSFYFEGGEILPADTAVVRSLKAAQNNHHYADAVWGAHESNQTRQKTIEQQLHGAQIIGLAKALAFGTVYSVQAAAICITAAGKVWTDRAKAPESQVIDTGQISPARLAQMAMRFADTASPHPDAAYR